MCAPTLAADFLETLVNQEVSVTPEKGLGRRFVGKLTGVTTTGPEDDDPMLEVAVNGQAWTIPWSEVARIQVDTAATRPPRHAKDYR
jgi:hypothetical protein